MQERSIDYRVEFSDFQFLQGYMVRRVFARNKGPVGAMLLGIVLCAIFIAMAIVINLQPWRVLNLFGLPYPLSAYVALILCLLAAILSLIPAIRLRTQTLRMQISDKGPTLGPTRLTIAVDGLVIERELMSAKYKWAALQSVELAKDAIVLPLEPGIGLIVPKKAFANDAARYAFAADISARIKAAKPNP